jgi:hypothetical protein
VPISDTRKKRGRPKIGATQINVRLPPADLAALDASIAARPGPRPSRPEAIRLILHEKLMESPLPSEPAAPRKKSSAPPSSAYLRPVERLQRKAKAAEKIEP